MKILLDLQGIQAPGTRKRGMGRYTTSLIKSVLRQNKEHEFHCLLNGSFPEAILEITDEFLPWISADNFHVFSPIRPTGLIDEGNLPRAAAAEICREVMIANLKPDLVHVTSLFEGLFDDAVLSIGRYVRGCPTTATLYDLIPLIHRTTYLENPDVERWYERRLSELTRADALLAISDSSAREAVRYLDFPADSVTNVTTDADPQFEDSALEDVVRDELLTRLGIRKEFVMYTGGIDWRKNIERLIAAFAGVSAKLRKDHQLVVVCAISSEQRDRLAEVMLRSGLTHRDVILTGYVSDTDLIGLYKSCKLFVFPSWHEGFGLPILEAMRCGAPVIGGNLSSIPEVIGLDDALFDPFDEHSIRDAIERALRDEGFRRRLTDHGKDQSRKFSWERAGSLALKAFEAASTSDQPSVYARAEPVSERKRLAFVSPIQPSASGIADYSAELLPQLARHYDIEVIVKDREAAEAIVDPYIISSLRVRTVADLANDPSRYDRILYHFGNSDHHNHMYHLIEDVPGVVVLHDFFLSGMISFEQYHYNKGDVWFDAIYESHGYSSIAYQHAQSDLHAAVMKYPANKRVVDNAIGMIVHSQHSVDLANAWLGPNVADDWHVIPHLRKQRDQSKKEEARKRVGIGRDDFVVSSFGFVNPTKQSKRILDAWLSSPLAGDKNARLMFVGANHPGDYGREMSGEISKMEGESLVSIVGWTDQDTFRDYLDASDVAIQLRMLSRGETSGTVLDAMNYGLATIVNAHGSMATLPKHAVLMLPDEFSDDELRSALTKVYEDSEFRAELSHNAMDVIRREHDPWSCGDAYFQAIEGAYRKPQITKAAILKILPSAISDLSAADLAQIATGADVATSCLSPVTYLDVSQRLSTSKQEFVDEKFAKLILELFSKDLPRRVEPIYFDLAKGSWRFARAATLLAIGMPIESFRDDVVNFAATADILFFEDHDSLASARVVGAWHLQPASSREETQVTPGHALAATFTRLGFEMKRVSGPLTKDKE